MLFPRLVTNAKGGDTWRNNYICDKTNEDILIFGSSRAIHHYVPSILSDSLGLTCYNCGQDGNGIILNYGRMQMIAQRHLPKFVIYDIQPSFDLHVGDDNHKYLKWLKAYYNRDGVKEIFQSVDRTESVKMLSSLYRFNSNFVQIVSDCIKPRQSMGQNGYRPLLGEMDTMKISRKLSEETKPIEFDSLKLDYWEKFVDLTSDSQLILVLSPTWNGVSLDAYLPLKKMAERHGLVFINFANDPKYMHNPVYFKDGAHLNARGAEEFSRDLSTILRQ